MIENGLKDQLIASLNQKDEGVKEEVKEIIEELLKDESKLESMGEVIQSDAFIANVSSAQQIEGIAKVLDAVEVPSAEKAKEIYNKIKEMDEVPE